NLLFDLEADPHEMRDLAGASAQADRVRKMMDLLAKQQKAYDDPNPLTVAKPGRAEVDLAFFQKVPPKKPKKPRKKNKG
ncbi:MAG: hypothetical protein OER86_08915, partial [Phycisphaerae bacterium]|nr:hypothetical protein [Phycisphaerae bacterium]